MARDSKTTIGTKARLALLYALVCSAADSGSGYECPIDGLRAVDFARVQVRTDQIETSDLITIWGDMHRRLRPRSSQRWFEDVLQRMAETMQTWIGGQAGAAVGLNIGFQLQRIRRSGTGQVSEMMKEVLVTLQGQLPR